MHPFLNLHVQIKPVSCTNISQLELIRNALSREHAFSSFIYLKFAIKFVNDSFLLVTFYTFYPFITKFNVDERFMNQVSKNIHKSFSFKQNSLHYKILKIKVQKNLQNKSLHRF